MRLPPLLLGLSIAVTALPVRAAVTFDVQASLDDSRLVAAQLELLDGDTVLCTLTKKGEKTSDSGCHEMKVAGNRLRLRGSYSVQPDDAPLRTYRGDLAVTLVDFASAGRELQDTRHGFGDAVRRYIAAVNTFTKAHLPDSVPHIEAGTPATAADVAAAEKRLGYALPAGFVALQRSVGALTVGDHSLTAIGHVDDAYTQIVRDWGTPRAAMAESYSAAFLDQLRHGVLLFTEVGDGLGGLLYLPGPTKSCGTAPAYVWTTQESGTAVLKRDDGSCVGFEEAFQRVLDAFVLDDMADDIASAAKEPTLLIDSSRTQTLRLSVDAYAHEFAPTVTPRWRGLLP